jgi:hypothetical protein
MITVDDPGIDEVQVRIRVSGSTITAENTGGPFAWIQEPGGPMIGLTDAPHPLEHGSQLWLGTQTFSFRAEASSAG